MAEAHKKKQPKVSESELPVRRVEAYSVPFQFVEGSDQIRLDATFYNPSVAQAISLLQHSGFQLRRLGDLVDRIFIPPRCGRTYVDREHGIPFLQGSHVVHFRPADLKYVSKTTQRHIDQLRIEAGWLLITRSGTVGRVVIAPKSWDGWAASEHVLRIVPRKSADIPAGYLYAFLCSFTGQAQLTSQIYGGVVDELTEGQVASVLVPVPRNRGQREHMDSIAALAMESLALKEKSLSLDEEAIESCDDLLASRAEDEADIASARTRIEAIQSGTESVIGGDELKAVLDDLTR